MNTEVAVNNVGIINTPNHPMYKRFSVEVIHEQKRCESHGYKPIRKISGIAYSGTTNQPKGRCQ